MDKQSLFTPELLAALQAAVATSDVFYTLGRTPAANVVSDVSEAVATAREAFPDIWARLDDAGIVVREAP